jgi:5-methyltetrahydrofolate--homocysteine methyltransferase
MRIINEAVKPGLDVVSVKVDTGEMFIPDLIMAGEAAKVSIDLITPLLRGGDSDGYKAKILMGVVVTDTHDIGKNVVKALLVADGFEVIDLGVDVAHEVFVENIISQKPLILAASAYTSASARGLGVLNEKLKEAGVRDDVIFLIGGAGVYSSDVPIVGADAYGADANEAVALCNGFLSN